MFAGLWPIALIKAGDHMSRQAAVDANERGKAFVQQGLQDDATAAFRHAVELDPTFAEAHNNFGNMLNHRLMRPRSRNIRRLSN